jgi:hypothetical protein
MKPVFYHSVNTDYWYIKVGIERYKTPPKSRFNSPQKSVYSARNSPQKSV